MVFDGNMLPMKAKVEQSRHELRQKNRELADELFWKGLVEEATKKY